MIKDKFHMIIATGFGIGKIPYAPGTFGSLFAVLVWVFGNKFLMESNFFPQEMVNVFWVLLLFLLIVVGVFSAGHHSKKTGKEDAKEIVIDEICGQLITFIIIAFFTDLMNSYWLLIFLGFVFFRLFDITKPFIIGLADKHIAGGIGIMLDDLLAGFAAAVLLYATYSFILFR